jgi:putative FmdB family regulatory protein
MPIYEYRCEHCGDFEETQRISDPPLQRCPKCRRKVRRLISNTSFQLKGSGWYVTDYARASGNGAKNDAKSESKSDSKSESTSDGGSTNASADTKSATKTEAKPATSTAEKSTS